jgi:hypothetical protein
VQVGEPLLVERLRVLRGCRDRLTRDADAAAQRHWTLQDVERDRGVHGRSALVRLDGPERWRPEEQADEYDGALSHAMHVSLKDTAPSTSRHRRAPSK